SAKGDDKFITTDYLQQCPSDRERSEVLCTKRRERSELLRTLVHGATKPEPPKIPAINRQAA
ncbi:hypothetical protein NDX95_23475, partial [Enterobacter roggenkampii]|uniref:hypothetical protein n=1 Tax=Enterobacter roggenkampii TaxID=1812935 RepID=UPI003F13F6CD